MKYIIMAGGQGTRLWPLSRENYPKQFLIIPNHNKSLLAMTYESLLCLTNPENIFTITNNEYYYIVRETWLNYIKEKINLLNNIICEPTPRNTCPAVVLSLLYLESKIPNSQEESFMVLPSDQIISPIDKFKEYIKIAEKAVKNKNIVIFGVKPNKPETGYGYIEVGRKINNNLFKVNKFIEKPKYEEVIKLIENNNYLWNCGIYCFKIKDFMQELKIYQPFIYEIAKQGYDYLLNNFQKLPSISIDYAVAEKTDKLVVVPMEIFWTDLGSWDSLYDIYLSESENFTYGNVLTLNTINSLILSTHRLIAAVNLKDLIIVETNDSILVTKKGSSNEIKELMNKIKNSDKEFILKSSIFYDKWGKLVVLESGSNYKINKIYINPSFSLDKHLHKNRSEHWIVLKGEAQILINDKINILKEGESIYANKGVLHQIINKTDNMLEILEIQYGDYDKDYDKTIT